ncbi:MAG TPA: FtsQ-type POTRA domain-containing protein [Aldersonia sp.]
MIGIKRRERGRADTDLGCDDAAAVDAAPPRRHRRRWLWTTLALLLVVGLTAAAWFSPVLSVRKVSVVGTGGVPQEEVLAALDVPQGEPLLQVDTAAAASRVAQIPKVAQARVQRVYPSTVRVTISERVPVAFYDSPEGPHLIDASAVAFAIESPPPGLPRLTVPTPATGDPTTTVTLDVLTTLPPPLRLQLGGIGATSISNIRLTLADGRVVIWGSATDSERKAAIALPLLAQPGRTYDVSSPDLPTVR